MTDIVGRLRHWFELKGGAQTAGLYLEAADEIERLRAALKGMLRVCPSERDGKKLAEYEAARAAVNIHKRGET